ncbi:MAG: sporulation protein [Bacteroidota bacterium]
MFGRVKRYLGIEGVKVELEVPEEIGAYKGEVEGKVSFISMNKQTVSQIRVKMIEKYTRGRGKDKKIDEYELGEIELKKNIEITPEKAVEIEFVLPFEMIRSEMEEFSNKNLLFKGIASVANLAYAAKSEYFIIAEAKVKGTALPPFQKKNINLL